MPAQNPATSDRRAMSAARHRPVWVELMVQAIAAGALLLSAKFAMQYLDPYREQREQAKKRAQFLCKKLGKKLELNEFEQLLAAHVMNPAHIEVGVADVLGLDTIIEELEYKVLYPLQRPEVYSTTLWKQTMGVLFYGPPGTGKTMLAKALAKQSGCFFLNISTSSILSKWLGDASRLVRAVFTLAEKLQPCIIFIDEVDALLGKRGSHQEHEAMLQVKTEFMQMWDGMESSRGHRIVVMGATNRPWMVDEAVLRRFSTQYEIGLPNKEQRLAILQGYLEKHHAETGGVCEELLHDLPDPSCSSQGGSLSWVASRTSGYSGSDLMELCSQAAQRGLAEMWTRHRRAAGQQGGASFGNSPGSNGGGGSTSASLDGGRGSTSGAVSGAKAEGEGERLVTRKVTRGDFEEALKMVLPSTRQAEDYRRGISQLSGGGGGGRGAGTEDLLSALGPLLLNLLAAQAGNSGGAGGGGSS